MAKHREMQLLEEPLTSYNNGRLLNSRTPRDGRYREVKLVLFFFWLIFLWFFCIAVVFCLFVCLFSCFCAHPAHSEKGKYHLWEGDVAEGVLVWLGLYPMSNDKITLRECSSSCFCVHTLRMASVILGRGMLLRGFLSSMSYLACTQWPATLRMASAIIERGDGGPFKCDLLGLYPMTRQDGKYQVERVLNCTQWKFDQPCISQGQKVSNCTKKERS